jgi:hypothetical protein
VAVGMLDKSTVWGKANGLVIIIFPEFNFKIWISLINNWGGGREMLNRCGI